MRRPTILSWRASALAVALWLAGSAHASIGDRLPDFKHCLEVCLDVNCGDDPTPVPIHHRLLLWDCPAECDYACQHIVTDTRLARDPPYREPVVQYHGKWPFHRFLGIQEPFSVLFSLLNLLAHDAGLAQLRAALPAAYPLRPYYLAFAYVGLASWALSMLFHTRDFPLTEKLDYFAAGANVLYGTYYAPVRVFRLDRPEPQTRTVLRAWTALCVLLYVMHVTYLTCWRWDYTYNMAANVVVGLSANVLWVWFSYKRYRRVRQGWTAWPAMIVAMIVAAMSMELLDFPPWRGAVDAHSLWHLGTVVPTIWWYQFLVKDAQDDMRGTRLKA